MSRNQTSYIITTPEGQTLLAVFKWTVSKGRDTYGYNICSLWIDGDKVSSCNGGGYDMKGTAFGKWLGEVERENLKKLTAHYGSFDDGTGFYGLSFYNPQTKKREKNWTEGCNIHLDGACGFSSMERIAVELGYKLQYKG